MLRRFETSITDQLNHLQETSSSLTTMNTQILVLETKQSVNRPVLDQYSSTGLV